MTISFCHADQRQDIITPNSMLWINVKSECWQQHIAGKNSWRSIVNIVLFITIWHILAVSILPMTCQNFWGAKVFILRTDKTFTFYGIGLSRTEWRWNAVDISKGGKGHIRDRIQIRYLHPKKPLCAEKPDGCAAFRIWCFVVSISLQNCKTQTWFCSEHKQPISSRSLYTLNPHDV